MITATVLEEINRLLKVDGKPTKSQEYRRQCVRTTSPTKSIEKDETSTCVEELWSLGRKLEWRRSGRLVQSFTGEGEILEALWANFLPNLICIVIRETERLRIYSVTGEQFLVSQYHYLSIVEVAKPLPEGQKFRQDFSKCPLKFVENLCNS